MKLIKFTAIPAFLFVLAFTGFAQSDSARFHALYAEFGIEFLTCAAPSKDYIRADVMPDYYGYQTSTIRALLYKQYAGIKYETRLLNNKLGILTGIRLTRTQGSIGKNTYWENTSDFFYFLLSSNGANTEYVRIKSIVQNSYYAGIPLELRIYPYRERGIQMYYKIGFDVQFLLESSTNISFYNDFMSGYADQIRKQIEEPWPVIASAYAGIGMKIGKSGKPGLNIEALFPTALFCDYNPSFVVPQYGGGFQINFRFPLK